MNHPPIVNEAKEFVTDYLQEHSDKKIVYHTLQHTEQLVEAARQMCLHYQLHSNEVLTTLVATWFADTGYYTDYQQHEMASAQTAENFLRKKGVSEDAIQDVKTCLLATKMPQNPVTLPQQIVCDATLLHLAAPDFN